VRKIGKGGRRVFKEHDAEAGRQPVVGIGRHHAPHVCKSEVNAGIASGCAAACHFNQVRTDIEAMDYASRRRPAPHFQRRPAAATRDVGDSVRCVQPQRRDQRFIDRRERRFHARKMHAPLPAAFA
jgi:hypothetical protein